MANATFANSYNITNRYDPFTWLPDSKTYVVPLQSPNLLYYMSSGVMYDPTPDDYNSYPASSFFPPLINDLKFTVDSTGRANLVLYIHGLGNTYSDALTAAANLGTTLQAAGYEGLVMGFSWPSYSELVAALTSYYATTRPPQATSGTIRDNINGSVGSFLAMLAQLQAIKINNNPINISVITHSEGNFMLMWGMAQYPKNSPPMNHSFMLAADISAAMLQGGQTGKGITGNFQDVNLYFSGCDPDLTYSDYEFFAYHDQSYPTRLGFIGPFRYHPANAGPPNVTALHCSHVTVDLGDILY